MKLRVRRERVRIELRFFLLAMTLLPLYGLTNPSVIAWIGFFLLTVRRFRLGFAFFTTTTTGRLTEAVRFRAGFRLAVVCFRFRELF